MPFVYVPVKKLLLNQTWAVPDQKFSSDIWGNIVILSCCNLYSEGSAEQICFGPTYPT